jgi:N-acetylmuramoyl-L-alanine amidase
MAIKIFIDQGHNPENPNAGAEGSGYREQDLVYRIGVILSDILTRRGFETRLSRATPEAQLGTSNLTSLQERVNAANAFGADYFISLHTNASASEAANGSEALVYSADSVAFDLARDILSQLSLSTGLKNRGVLLRPGLYVLRKTNMPAVLVELGFITNQNDASLMASSPELFAVGVADGISEYLRSGGAWHDDVSSKAIPIAVNIASPETVETLESFLSENDRFGELKIQAFKARMAYPVPSVSISVSRKFSDGEHVFFEGVTDGSGIIDGIKLPAPPIVNSLSSHMPENTAVYTVKAFEPNYNDITRSVEIFEGIKSIQPLAMTPKGIGGE